MKTIKLIAIVVLTLMTSSCVQETHLKTIIFKVDMRGAENISNLGVKGQFSSPSWEKTIPLTDENNDNIYEAQVEFRAAQYDVEFKFVKNDEYELQDMPNRSIKFEYKPETFVYSATFNNPKSKITKK